MSGELEAVSYAQASAAFWAGYSVDALCSGFSLVHAGEFSRAHVELFAAHHSAEYAYRLWEEWQPPPRKTGRRNVRTR